MPWSAGKSGNPRGRTKTAHAVTVFARKHCRDAIKFAVEVFKNADADMRYRLKAAEMILNRGIGSPAQCVTASQLTDEELVAELMQRKAARAERERDPSGANGVQ